MDRSGEFGGGEGGHVRECVRLRPTATGAIVGTGEVGVTEFGGRNLAETFLGDFSDPVFLGNRNVRFGLWFLRGYLSGMLSAMSQRHYSLLTKIVFATCKFGELVKKRSIPRKNLVIYPAC